MKNNNEPLIIAFDTSCDETSVAVLRGRKLLSNIVSSQVELHKKWGGVVPMLARRAHEENIDKAFNEALKRAEVEVADIDYIAATYGPGLAIDLEVGLQFAQKLAIENQKPFIPVNHMEGHLLSALILNSKGKGVVNEIDKASLFPALGMLASGKHTELIYVEGFGKYRILGETLDDAAGEAFDKVGRMLDFGYPGGPIVSNFAIKGTSRKGLENDFGLPVPMKTSADYNFSYSGLKTACLYKIKQLREDGEPDKEWVYDFCYAFVDSVVESVEVKVKRALKEFPEIKSVFAGGGVWNNEVMSRRIGNLVRSKDRNFYLPDKKFRSDNAAMIGVVGYFCAIENRNVLLDAKDIAVIDRSPRLSF